MKYLRLLILVVLVGSGISANAQKATINKVDIQTSAICEMCKDAIEYELTYSKGIKSAELDLETKKVLVEFNEKKTTAEEIRKIITMVGYHADDMVRDSLAYENLPFCCKDGAHADEHDDH